MMNTVPPPPQLLGFDEMGSTLVFATEAPVDDSVDVSPEFVEGGVFSKLTRSQRPQMGAGRAAPKILVHELSGIW